MSAGGVGTRERRASRFAGDSANYLVRHLIGVAGAIRARVGAEVAARGHDLTPATSHLIVNLPVDGSGMSELATRLRLTLQRTGQLVDQLEDLGYVERVPDEHDGRAKRVVFSRRGRRLLADIDRIDAEVTRDVAAALGKRGFAQLCRDLEKLDRAFTGDDDALDL